MTGQAQLCETPQIREFHDSMSIDSTGQKEAKAAGEHANISSVSGLVVEHIAAIDVTRARFPADA